MQKTKTDIDMRNRKKKKEKIGKHALYYKNACFILYIRILYILYNIIVMIYKYINHTFVLCFYIEKFGYFTCICIVLLGRLLQRDSSDN